jgi:hypothetical protein
MDRAVRNAFRAQAEYCARLDSPFTGLLCRMLADVLSSQSEAGREILGWRGDPAPLADNLPLRVVGALHALARSGNAPELASIYPPAPLPAADRLADVLRRALRRHAAEISAFLPFTPQTNVRRRRPRTVRRPFPKRNLLGATQELRGAITPSARHRFHEFRRLGAHGSAIESWAGTVRGRLAGRRPALGRDAVLTTRQPGYRPDDAAAAGAARHRRRTRFPATARR